MKLAVASFALSLTVAVLVAGCGPPALTCQSQSCSSSSTKTFQLCVNSDGSDTYNFGGVSCHCGGSSGVDCQSCATGVTNYCDAGGGGAGGAGGGGGGVTCTSVFSGGISGSYSPCAVSIIYNASSGTTLATAGNAIPGTPYTWNGFSMTLAGMPATGTFDQTMSTATSDSVMEPGSQTPPLWQAGYGNGQTFGTASVTITSLGPPSVVNGTTLYQSPHGTFTATLVDQNAMTHMPDILQTVSF